MATTVLSIRQNGRRNKPENDAVKEEVLDSSQDLVIVHDEVPVEVAFEFQAKGAKIADGSESRRFTNHQPYSYRPEILSHAFACPFRKHRATVTTQASSQKECHPGCSSEVFSSVALLKDHILKVHLRSQYYCSSCYEGFETRVILEAHSRCNPPCSPRPCGQRETILKERSSKIVTIDDSKTLKDYWYEAYRILFPNSPEPSSPYVPFYQHVSFRSRCQSTFRDLDADRCQTPSLSYGTSHSSSLAPSDLSCRNSMSIGSNESCYAESGYQSRGHRPANATPTTSIFCPRTDPASLLAHVGAQFPRIELDDTTQQEDGLKAEDWQSSISADELHLNLAGTILSVRTATRQFVANTAGDPAGVPNDGYQAEAPGSGRKRARDEHISSTQLCSDDNRDDESESGNEQPPSGTQLPDGAEPQANREVKCPLAALNPEAYPECKGRPFRNTDALTRINGWTGHLLRKHENHLSDKAKDHLLKRNGERIEKQYGDEYLCSEGYRWIEIFRICGNLEKGSLRKAPSPWFGDTNILDSRHFPRLSAAKKARTEAPAASTLNTAATIPYIEESHLDSAVMEDWPKELRDECERQVAKRRARGQEEIACHCARIEKDVQVIYAQFSQKSQEFREVGARQMISSYTSKQTDAVSAQLRQEAGSVMRRSQSNRPVALSPPPANYHGRAEQERNTVAPDGSTMIPDSSFDSGSYLPIWLSYAPSEVERARPASSCISFESPFNFTPDEGSRSNTSASSLSFGILKNIDPRLLENIDPRLPENIDPRLLDNSGAP